MEYWVALLFVLNTPYSVPNTPAKTALIFGNRAIRFDWNRF
jgi:hypothetical protein